MDEKTNAIRNHVFHTIKIARWFDWAVVENDPTESALADAKRAIVEMVFNPQTDVDRSRVMAVTMDEDTALFNPTNDTYARMNVVKHFYDDARMRRRMEADGTPLYLRMKGRADRIARAYQREHGEAELGLREIWYQFDWFSAKVIDEAIEYATNFKDEKETDND